MDFGILRGLIDTKSYLNMDDINGAGSRTYKKLSNIPSCDFALFKISNFALCESSSDRKKFTSELPNTLQELGPRSLEFIEPLLISLVFYL